MKDVLHRTDTYYEWIGSLNALGDIDTSLNVAKLDSIFSYLMSEKFPLKHAWYQYNDTKCGFLDQPYPPKLYIELTKRDDRCIDHSFTCREVMIFNNLLIREFFIDSLSY